MRDYSSSVLSRVAESRGLATESLSIGFVGNIANNLYNRAVPLRKAGYSIDIYLHPYDRYVMSQPGWEEFDGTLPDGVRDMDALAIARIKLPEVPGVYQLPSTAAWPNLRIEDIPSFVRAHDFLRWKPYLSYLPTLQALQAKDVLLSVQVPYLAYLSSRPYAVTQAGGEIWYECSRDDALGRLQRTAFEKAAVFLVSNPWSFAHARRYGFRHLVYLPMTIDEDIYSPGASTAREEWRLQVGGNFFVLVTSRLDDQVKGSTIGLEGFAKFAASAPEARLVVMNWGQDRAKLARRLRKLGIESRVLVLPIAGKRRVIDYLRSADCLVDQFVLGYFGASGLEAMACGLPVIMRLERSQYDALCYSGAPPVLDAQSVDDVAQHLRRLALNRDERKRNGEQLRSWFLNNHGSRRWGQAYIDVLTAIHQGKGFAFDKSPLCNALSREEREYHADQMLKAPQFPQYQ